MIIGIKTKKKKPKIMAFRELKHVDVILCANTVVF